MHFIIKVVFAGMLKGGRGEDLLHSLTMQGVAMNKGNVCILFHIVP